MHLLRDTTNAACLAQSIAQFRPDKIENHGLMDDWNIDMERKPGETTYTGTVRATKRKNALPD